MKIRQYTAATMQEAILKIKVDLGPDAVILHTRKFKRGGFMGMFAQEMVEVLAAIDPNGESKSDANEGKGRQASAGQRDRQFGNCAVFAEYKLLLRQYRIVYLPPTHDNWYVWEIIPPY
ncbi:MAG: hypothetical protein ACK46X_08730, partial [Candidatus Sericytochromatia bacterium]